MPPDECRPALGQGEGNGVVETEDRLDGERRKSPSGLAGGASTGRLRKDVLTLTKQRGHVARDVDVGLGLHFCAA